MTAAVRETLDDSCLGETLSEINCEQIEWQQLCDRSRTTSAWQI
jgi:hypothetical protein